ncbi:MAG TPA: type III-B CRISPR module RAMP protein Cmr1 [Pseudonocardiaceae bacterium]|jgi:CRISPR-associated protein Cmr1|nr:type III-B CRISPR module RAMP protein Cmr1 [Pseudonocardiaceae bacterium]
MSWIRLTLAVRTPLFSGDDPVVEGTPVRVPSIRGALRYWFRAVAAGHGVSDLTQLWADEQAVFGSTKTPSAIGLRVPRQPVVNRDKKPGWATTEQRGFDGAQYLLGQGLWDYCGEAASSRARSSGSTSVSAGTTSRSRPGSCWRCGPG